jgi:NADH-quinone oxidoreductase subunit I
MTYFKNIWLGIYTVLVGMKITLKHLFVNNVTVQYPNVHPTEKAGHDKMPANARNRLFNDYEDCNGCMGCMRACPVNCIVVETLKVVPTDNIPTLRSGGKRGLWVTKYTIDMAKCCFCGLCIEPCPTFSIKMTNEFEYSEYDRGNLLYDFGKMTPEEIKQKQDLLAQFNAEKKRKEEEAKKADEAKKAQENQNIN